jgi:hypothetical protein
VFRPFVKGVGFAVSPRGRRVLRHAVSVARSDEARKLAVQARKLAASPEARRVAGEASQLAAHASHLLRDADSRGRVLAALRQLSSRL